MPSFLPQQIHRNDRKDILAGERGEKEKQKERRGKEKEEEKGVGGEEGERRSNSSCVEILEYGGRRGTFNGRESFRNLQDRKQIRLTEERNHNTNSERKSLRKVGIHKVGFVPSSVSYQKCYIPHTQKQCSHLMRNVIFFLNGLVKIRLLTYRKAAVKESSIQHSLSIFYMARLSQTLEVYYNGKKKTNDHEESQPTVGYRHINISLQYDAIKCMS